MKPAGRFLLVSRHFPIRHLYFTFSWSHVLFAHRWEFFLAGSVWRNTRRQFNWSDRNDRRFTSALTQDIEFCWNIVNHHLLQRNRSLKVDEKQLVARFASDDASTNLRVWIFNRGIVVAAEVALKLEKWFCLILDFIRKHHVWLRPAAPFNSLDDLIFPIFSFFSFLRRNSRISLQFMIERMNLAAARD